MRRRLKNGDEMTDRGYTRVWRDGRWLLKQRVLWEENYGPIPEGHYILFLDGDRTNLSLDNLSCQPRATVTSVNKSLGRGRHPELAKAQILLHTLTTELEGVMG